MSDVQALAARREADAARAALFADVGAIRHRLRPAVIAEHAGRRASTMLERANAQVRGRPGAATAVLGLAMLVFARHRIARRFARAAPDTTSP